MSFRTNLVHLTLPIGPIALLTDVAEAKGRQDLLLDKPPEILTSLRETALVQSVESSNRIEGVTVAPDRLRPLVLGNDRPRDRSEEEIQGYRRALELIHAEAKNLVITPELLQRLHATIQEGSGDAGQWKQVDNEIIELREGAPPLVRFRPVKVAETPAAVEELCLLYRHALNQSLAPPLVAAAALVFDFLCIHPFRDGNGRVSRLLTLLALYQHGYEVGRYVSLERLVEESRAEYYRVLRRAPPQLGGVARGAARPHPWLSFFLAILKRAYRELDRLPA
jgi:Fic family protein